MVTIDSFLAAFPEFEGRIDDDVLLLLIDQVTLETNGYSGLPSRLQDHALTLRVAYEVEKIAPLNQFMNGNVKRLESLNDKIEYAIANIDLSDLDANVYGMRLKRLLRTNYCGGFAV